MRKPEVYICIRSFNTCFSESLKFIRELSEMRVIEEQTVTLECEVNQPGLTATWLKDKQPVVLKKSDSIRVKDGMHSLVIASVEIDDEAEYTVQIGELSSSAPLFVEGKWQNYVVITEYQ